MNNISNVKSNLASTHSINPTQSDIESYLYATDDADRYADYLSDKWTLETKIQSNCIRALTV